MTPAAVRANDRDMFIVSPCRKSLPSTENPPAPFAATASRRKRQAGLVNRREATGAINATNCLRFAFDARQEPATTSSVHFIALPSRFESHKYGMYKRPLYRGIHLFLLKNSDQGPRVAGSALAAAVVSQRKSDIGFDP
jgi:hypothetical protein